MNQRSYRADDIIKCAYMRPAGENSRADLATSGSTISRNADAIYLFIYLFIYLIRQMAPLSTLRRSEIAGITERRQTVVKVRDRGAQPPAPIWAPCNSMSSLIESIKCYFIMRRHGPLGLGDDAVNNDDDDDDDDDWYVQRFNSRRTNDIEFEGRFANCMQTPQPICQSAALVADMTRPVSLNNQPLPTCLRVNSA